MALFKKIRCIREDIIKKNPGKSMQELSRVPTNCIVQLMRFENETDLENRIGSIPGFVSIVTSVSRRVSPGTSRRI